MRRTSLALGLFLFIPDARAGADWLNIWGLGADYSPGSQGGGAGLEWGHNLGPSTLGHIGGFGFEAAGSRWGYVRVGGNWKAAPRTTVHGRADLGRGRFSDQSPFDYQVLVVGLTQNLSRHGLSAQVEEQYVDVGRAQGHVLRLGATAASDAGFAATGSFHQSLGGSVQAHYFSGRVDLNLAGAGLLGGITTGRGRSDIRGLYVQGAQKSTEVFAGLRLSRDLHDVALILGRLKVGPSVSYSLQLNYRLPL